MTIAGVLFLAVIDSINPSAIVVTLYLLSIARSRALVQVVVYVGAIFITYLLLGGLMVLGTELIRPSLGGALRSRPGLIAQSLVGLALLYYSLTASTNPMRSQVVARPSASTFAALVVLGVSVTAMELPTAIPYFAAIALISEAELPIRTWAPLLGIYNLIFVLPPIALLVGHLVLQKRLADPYAALRQRLESGAREIMAWVAGLVGGFLFVTGIIELVARLR
jgi:NADH:ubiquinone oxidoreductase subunit 6 (subunit J)